MDNTDKNILNTLLQNARLSCREIAKIVGVSAVTVLKRIKSLEKQGSIKSYTAELDYEKLGYDISIIIKMRISKGRLIDVQKKIATHPNIFAVYDVTGAFDSIVIAKFKNRRRMDAFVKKIQTYEFIERTETMLILNTLKEKNIEIS